MFTIFLLVKENDCNFKRQVKYPNLQLDCVGQSLLVFWGVPLRATCSAKWREDGIPAIPHSPAPCHPGHPMFVLTFTAGNVCESLVSPHSWQWNMPAAKLCKVALALWYKIHRNPALRGHTVISFESACSVSVFAKMWGATVSRQLISQTERSVGLAFHTAQICMNVTSPFPDCSGQDITDH